VCYIKVPLFIREGFRVSSIKFNIAALMGYTGAVSQQFFGGFIGIIISVVFMLLWILIPLSLSTGLFKRKDF
jgi:Cu-processing system permease protein